MISSRQPIHGIQAFAGVVVLILIALAPPFASKELAHQPPVSEGTPQKTILTIDQRIKNAITDTDLTRGLRRFRILSRRRLEQLTQIRECPFDVIDGYIFGCGLVSQPVDRKTVDRFTASRNNNSNFDARAEHAPNGEYQIIMEVFNELDAHLYAANNYKLSYNNELFLNEHTFIVFGFVNASPSVDLRLINSLALEIVNIAPSVIDDDLRQLLSPLEATYVIFERELGRARISFRSVASCKRAARLLDRLVIRGVMMAVRPIPVQFVHRDFN